MIISLSMWPPRRRPNTTGSRTVPTSFLTDAQWARIRDLFENPDPSPKGGRPRIEPRECLEGILWICDRAPSGSICQSVSPVRPRAGGDTETGPKPGSSSKHGGGFSRILTVGDGSTGHRRWGMAPFRLQKKGPRGWQDQEGQGHQADVDDGRKGNSRLRIHDLCPGR